MIENGLLQATVNNLIGLAIISLIISVILGQLFLTLTQNLIPIAVKTSYCGVQTIYA